MLERKALLIALNRLGEVLTEHGEYAVIDVYGGSAMSLAYSSTRVTQDVDAVLTQSSMGNLKFLNRVKQVARELNLSPDWLNEDIASIMRDDALRRNVVEFGKVGGLTVRVATAEQLLACKLFAARVGGRDLADAAILAKALGFKARAELVAVVKRYFRQESIERQNRRKGLHNSVYNMIDAVLEKVGEGRV